MKKSILFFVCICLFFSFTSVRAEVGFDKMTDEELLLAQEELKNEIMKRGLVKKATLPAGYYEAGVDIPAGKYIVTAVTTHANRYPSICIYKDKKDAASLLSLSIISEQVLADYGSCMITLEEGQVLKLEAVTYTIEKYSIPLL